MFLRIGLLEDRSDTVDVVFLENAERGVTHYGLWLTGLAVAAGRQIGVA